jgi:O-acetyl-ADP-ribose deacetylase (regulator of RNase III)
MIRLVQGNILEADAEALVNTVNCVGVMGKGIALQFKQAYPANFRAYERACKAGEVQPGRMFVTATDSLVNPRYIINFPTKRHWRQPSRMEDIRAGLDALVSELRERRIQSVAIPPLGCGNGGLDWAEVRPLIETALEQVPEVEAVLFEPHGAPAAERMRVGTERPRWTVARALVTALVARYREPGYRLGRLEVQKLGYLLQAAGEPLQLDYAKQQYGPYAENLNHLLQHIEGHFLRGYGDRSGPSGLVPLPDAATEARQFLGDHPESQVRLQRVTNLIDGFETPYGMELLATVHWVCRENPAAAEDVSQAVAGVQGWNPRKRERFRPEHIELAWQRLREQGWLAAGTPVS